MEKIPYEIGKEGFVWFLGVVEDRKDPDQTGRVRVRCFGWHTDNKELIPTDALPWAHITQPPNLPASYTPKEGDMVFGFFLDAHSAQHPVVLGVIPGKPEQKANPTKGFSDPSGKYPKRVGESTFSRLARGDKYPFNYVHETESGHTFELDDNGAGRIKLSHNNGTYVEFDTDGNQINVVKKNNRVTIGKDNLVQISGDCKLSVGGDMTISCGGAFNVKASDINFDSSGAMNMRGMTIGQDALADFNIKSVAGLKLDGGLKLSMNSLDTTLSGAKVDVAGALVNIQAGSPESPDDIPIPDFEADIMASAAAVPGVSTGATGLLGKIQSGLNKVNSAVKAVTDKVDEITSVATGTINTVRNGIAKELSPLTQTIGQVRKAISDVNDAVKPVMNAVNDVGRLMGKEIFPQTTFLDKALDKVDNVSNKIERVYDPLNKLTDKVYALNMSAHSTLGDEIIQPLNDLNQAVNSVNTLMTEVPNSARKIQDLGKKLKASLPADTKIKTDLSSNTANSTANTASTANTTSGTK